jgi:hypothetical protein
VTDGRCADLSLEAGESLAATATTARDWLLVESPETWPRDVSDLSGLDQPTQAAVNAWLADTAGRLLFIRRPGRAGHGRLVFVVRATEDVRSVRRIKLGDAATLAGVDLGAAGEPVDTELVLVCGHGTRDACCALRGNTLYAALADSLAGRLWLSSHQGGHRFAANVLVLPLGIQLGRVAPEGAATLVTEALAGRIPVEHYRGRTSYSGREQAAERVVREVAALRGLSDLRLAGDDGRYVRFEGADGHTHVALVEEVPGPPVPASCGAAPEPQTHFHAQLV